MPINWERALRLETRVAQIIQDQEENGVLFNHALALEHIDTLQGMMDEWYVEIRPLLDQEVESPYDNPVNKPFLKNGSYSKATHAWMEGEVDTVWGPFTRIHFVEPDLGSRVKLIKQLLRHGWKPTIFTEPSKTHPEGQPKLTVKGEPVQSLFKIAGDVGSLIAKWYVASHRKSQIAGFIKLIREDGRITAGADSCGTNTCRMRHKGVVNVPKAKKHVFFGHQMRELFCVPDGMVMCGHDAAGLEARMEAHYTWPYDDGEYAAEILGGDIHTKNAKIFDVNRDLAKNGKYGLTYGAQPKKLAETLGCSLKRGKQLFDDFWEQNYALGKLRENVMTASQRGWIPGIDGRKIYIRSSHSAVNALFQSAGAIVMKVAMTYLDHWAREEGLRWKKLIDMHDEGQNELFAEDVVLVYTATEEEALAYHKEGQRWAAVKEMPDGQFRTGYSRFGELAVESIVKAGQVLGVRCDLDGEYILGYNWAECH